MRELVNISNGTNPKNFGQREFSKVYWWEIEASTRDPTSVLCDGIKTIRFGAVEYNNLAELSYCSL
jgi:hypothetical protein